MKKNMLWMLLSLMAATIMMPLSATAQGTPTQTRIAVVSDIHVMAPSLLPEGAKVEGTEWTADYANERKMLEQSAGLFDQFIDAMKSEAPDVLLITGDLTKDGEMASHQYVIDKLAELKTALKNKKSKIYVIPGNHDITTGTVYKYDDEGKRSALENDEKMTTTAAFASSYQGYGYGIEKIDDNNNNFVQDPNGSLSYVAEIADGLYLLAIDSHNNGIVSQNTLTWICDQAKVIRGAGKRVIAMMHHPLFPHIKGANMFIDTYTVKYEPTKNNANTYEDVRNALIDAGVNVILTGHFHTSDIAYDWKDDADNGIYDINTGSLISYPCDYRILTLSADKSTLDVNTNSLPEAEALQPIESENRVSWKNWLQRRIELKVTNALESETYSSLDPEDKTFLISIASRAYCQHAEGNENNSETLLKEFNDYDGNSLTYSGAKFILSPMFNSMLKDISNYVNGSLNSGHENRTNDRTLSNIVLTTSGTGTLDNALNLLNNEDNRTIINLYDGEKNVTVTLSGRTFLKDKAWNTICLPFDVTIEDSQLQGAEARALTGASIKEETEGITLNLTFGDPVTKLDAGRPYIIKWESGENITTDLTFNDVTINKTMHIDGDEDYVTFRGTYAWQQFTDENPTMLLIGKNSTTGKSTLFYPVKGVSLASLGAFRAYFQLADGYTAGESIEGGGGTIRNFVLNFGDDDSATGIIAIGNSQSSTLNAQRSEWFTLDGRRLAAKPTAKGLYIHAGRKVVIK